jgi:alanine dehydrogenase
MLIGVPSEIKANENRVGLVPACVRELTARGHEVVVETGAGQGAGLSDDQYVAAGAQILPDAAAVFASAQMIVKVKVPQPAECAMLRRDQVLFTYLHLAADRQPSAALCQSGCIAIAYETITDAAGRLPLLAPMSEVAGRMAVHAGARCLEQAQGGSGILLGGVPGVEPAKVVIIGAGVAGSHALAMATGLGADVTVIDRDLGRLKALDAQYAGRVRTVFSTSEAIERHVVAADLVIGTVLVPGAAAPKLVTREMVAAMKPGAVIVDVAVDQGGCCATTRATTHATPTFVEDGVVHYCVANMPGGVARTSTFALNNATLPYVMALAEKGWRKALADDAHFKNGLNVCQGRVTFQAVARDLALDYTPAETCLAEAA